MGAVVAVPKLKRRKMLIHTPREHALSSLLLPVYNPTSALKLWDHTAVCWSSRPGLSASFPANCK